MEILNNKKTVNKAVETGEHFYVNVQVHARNLKFILQHTLTCVDKKKVVEIRPVLKVSGNGKETLPAPILQKITPLGSLYTK